MVKVKKELYVRHPREGVAVMAGRQYMRPAGLELKETHTFAYKSDESFEPKVRYSSDNGRTWSQFEPAPEIMSFHDDYDVVWGGGTFLHDPHTQLTVSVWLRQTRMKQAEKLHYSHCYCRVSSDDGRTWSEGDQFRYEDGARFDADNPLDPSFLDNNRMYPGNNMIRHSNGTLIYCGTNIRIPDDAPDPNPAGRPDSWMPAASRNIGSACFIGRWNEQQGRYVWRCGACAWVPRSVSSRGLMEAEVVELAGGRVLVVWRGNNTDVTPGRKFFSVSDDGGVTLSAVNDFRYDDGSQFYSPSSIHRMIRSSVTGKLYWAGNITPTPPRAGLPRWPLVIAEVDETIPALKKDTVTIIDDRQPGEGWGLQLSNFCLLENRETHDFEVYLTRLGTKATEQAPFTNKFLDADCYKYTLSFD